VLGHRLILSDVSLPGSVLVVVRVTRERFEEMVNAAFEELPDRFRDAVENVALIVEDRSANDRLFGLYEGIPLTRRSPLSYGGVMPDRITIYQETMSDLFDTEEELEAQVRKTVLHEIGHYFGIDDPRLAELGWG
jgi:predicted Zn-dependent protease with MMP-like domain